MTSSSRVLFDPVADREPVPVRPPRAVGIMAGLSTLFSLFALNVVVVLSALPLVSLPLAMQAAEVALDRWREDQEERMVREFLRAFRALPTGRTFIRVGVPIAVAAAALLEIRFFAITGGGAGAVGAGLGAAGLLLALAGLGYVLMLGVRQPNMRPTDAWYLAVALVATNLLGASALLVGEFALLGTLALLDPPLIVIGLPVAALVVVRMTAEHGIHRTQQRMPGAADFFDDLEVNQ
jgi:hypothetical protein